MKHCGYVVPACALNLHLADCGGAVGGKCTSNEKCEAQQYAGKVPKTEKKHHKPMYNRRDRRRK